VHRLQPSGNKTENGKLPLAGVKTTIHLFTFILPIQRFRRVQPKLRKTLHVHQNWAYGTKPSPTAPHQTAPLSHRHYADTPPRPKSNWAAARAACRPARWMFERTACDWVPHSFHCITNTMPLKRYRSFPLIFNNSVKNDNQRTQKTQQVWHCTASVQQIAFDLDLIFKQELDASHSNS
jgi:hypothetical protein